MRDEGRIDRILLMISYIWHQAPDLRLGQLLTNFAEFNDDNYATEDDTMEKNLKYWYSRMLKNNKSEDNLCYGCDLDNPSCNHCNGC
jgi:hypothetical protein